MYQELKELEQAPIDSPEAVRVDVLTEYAGRILTSKEVESLSNGGRVAFALETDESMRQTFGSTTDLTTALVKATGMDKEAVVEGNHELKHHSKDEAERVIFESSGQAVSYVLTDAGKEFLKQQIEKSVPLMN